MPVALASTLGFGHFIYLFSILTTSPGSRLRALSDLFSPVSTPLPALPWGILCLRHTLPPQPVLPISAVATKRAALRTLDLVLTTIPVDPLPACPLPCLHHPSPALCFPPLSWCGPSSGLTMF